MADTVVVSEHRGTIRASRRSKSDKRSPKKRTARFVLVDPSIVSVGGHYLEYAVRLLEAVGRNSAYQPILATNRVFDTKSFSHSEIEATAIFKYDIWGSSKDYDKHRPRTLAQSSAYYRHTLSKLNWLWSLTKNPDATSDYFKRFGMAPQELRWLEKLMNVRRQIAQFPCEDDETEVDLIRRFLGGERMEDGHSEPALASIRRSTDLASSVRSDIDTLIAQLELSENDYVFMPTMGWHDLSGLTEYFRTRKDRKHPHFGILFRRNIYDCQPDEYTDQAFAVHDLAAAFDRLQQHATDQIVSVFTDTKQLTAQYRTVCDLPITTVPIPAPDCDPAALRRTAGKKDDIVLGYLGDARDEKGFQHLPPLLERLKKNDDGVPVRTAKLRAQCYFAPGHSDMNIVKAHTRLHSSNSGRLEIIDGVLGADAYKQAIENTDVMLIPYKRTNYTARSSGIFTEALAANRPVIVPAGTWMANELDSRSHGYHTKAISPSSVVSQQSPAAIRWHIMGRDSLIDYGNNGEITTDPSYVTFFTTETPPMATHLWLKFDVKSAGFDAFAQITIGARDKDQKPVCADQIHVVGGGSEKRSIVVPAHNTQIDAWISIANAYSESPLEIRNMEVAWINSSSKICRVAGGATFRNDGALDACQSAFGCAVEEVLRDYGAFVTSAREIGEEFRNYHSAKNLFELVQKSSSRSTEHSKADN